jgi:IclR family pca regulon transcriptional regulator
VLSLSSAYLSAINTEVVLQPFLQEVVNEVGGSSSVTLLDDLDIVYIAHASQSPAIRLTASTGSRYPVYATAMGRVLLAFQPDEAIEAYLNRATLKKLTEYTETDPAAIRRILTDVRGKGYAAIQDELDYGLISVALPVFGPRGQIVAAADCSDVAERVDGETIISKHLPALRDAIRRVEHMLTRYPELANSVESITTDHRRPLAVARVGELVNLGRRTKT